MSALTTDKLYAFNATSGRAALRLAGDDGQRNLTPLPRWRTAWSMSARTTTSSMPSTPITGGLLSGWPVTTGSSIQSSPRWRAAAVFVGSADDKLYAFNARSGALLWTATTGSFVYSSPLWRMASSMSALSTTISTPSTPQRRHAGGRQRPAAKSTNLGPAVANGMVYVGSGDHSLYAYALNGGNDGRYRSKRKPPAISFAASRLEPETRELTQVSRDSELSEGKPCVDRDWTAACGARRGRSVGCGASGAWAAGPKIAMSPAENHPNSNTQVNGNSFGADEAVDIYFDTTDEALAFTNSNGVFGKTPVPVPASALPARITSRPSSAAMARAPRRPSPSIPIAAVSFQREAQRTERLGNVLAPKQRRRPRCRLDGGCWRNLLFARRGRWRRL